MKSDTKKASGELSEKRLRTPAEVLDEFLPWWRAKQRQSGYYDMTHKVVFDVPVREGKHGR